MISVCLATYNGARYLREQVKSILSQLDLGDEVVISDDNSSDTTRAVVAELNDKRIRFITNAKERRGFKNNFENALRNAKGDFIFLSDQDDVWVSDKVEVVMNLLGKFDLVVSDAAICDENLQTKDVSLYEEINSGRGIIKNIVKSTYYGCCMAFKRNVLDTALPFPNTTVIGHDLWLGLVAETVGSVIFSEKQLVQYRRHEHTFTKTGTGYKSRRNLLVKVLDRIIMLGYYLSFLFSRRYKKGIIR